MTIAYSGFDDDYPGGAMSAPGLHHLTVAIGTAYNVTYAAKYSVATPALVARGLYVGTTGNVSLTTPNGETEIYYNVPAGYTIPVMSTIVNATGTTASNLVAIW